jgi:hypothetical protein
MFVPYKIKGMTSSGELSHYGVKGMKWGVRKSEPSTWTKEQRKAARKRHNDLAVAAMESKYRTGEDLFTRKMTDEEYNKLSTKDQLVRKGTNVRRVTKRSAETYGESTYVSYTKSDQSLYRAVMPLTNSKNPFKSGGSKSYKQHYEVTFKAVNTLKSPSEKARVDAFIGLMDTKSITLKNGKTVTGREYLKRSYPKEVKRLNSHQLGLRAYKDFTEMQYADTPLNSAYFKAVREKGYNSVIDDNDRGHLSEDPLIVLNPNGTLKKMSVKPLSADDVNQALLDLKIPEGKEYS